MGVSCYSNIYVYSLVDMTASGNLLGPIIVPFVESFSFID